MLDKVKDPFIMVFLKALQFRQYFICNISIEINAALIESIYLLIISIRLKDIRADIFQHHIHVNSTDRILIRNIGISIQEFFEITDCS